MTLKNNILSPVLNRHDCTNHEGSNVQSDASSCFFLFSVNGGG